MKNFIKIFIQDRIFSIKNENYHKVISILGIKFKFVSCKKIISKLHRYENYRNFYEKMNDKYAIDCELYRPHVVDWFESFKYYALQNNMVEKIKLLKRGLNLESNFVIDLFLSRMMLLPDCSICEDFLLSKHLINNSYTEWEKDTEEKYKKLLPKIEKEFNLLGNKFLVETFFFHNGLYFCNEKQKSYIKNKDFIDGGAWIGDSVLVFEKYYNPRKTYSFEVSKKLAKQYLEVMSLNNIDKNKYELVLGGLSDKSSVINFNDTADTGTSVLSSGKDEVELISIDEFVKLKKLNIGFLKIDVEGHAYEAIDGAKEVIKRDRPIICVAVYHSPHEFFDTKPLLDKIVRDLNYKIEFKQMQYRPYLLIEYVLFAYPAELEYKM